jgi:hypothetical protein
LRRLRLDLGCNAITAAAELYLDSPSMPVAACYRVTFTFLTFVVLYVDNSVLEEDIASLFRIGGKM